MLEKSTHPAIALVGNPGTGKSTILNGLVNQSVFSSGMAFATGLTQHLQEYRYQDVSYFDTPGLDDIEKRKQAGEEIDKVLGKDIELRIVFVVVALNGRVRSEDATTIELVLDAIKSASSDNMNERFGVVINQMPQRMIDGMRSNEVVERRVRTSITGSRHTSHWCYLVKDDELECKENGMLMTDELRKFFDTVPTTKPKGTQVENVDTASWQERLQEQTRMFAEKERLMTQELETQKKRAAMVEKLTDELKCQLNHLRDESTERRQETAAIQQQLAQERESNVERRQEMQSLQEQLRSNEERRQEQLQVQEQLNTLLQQQQQEMESARQNATRMNQSFDEMRQRADQNEEKAQMDMEEMQQRLLEAERVRKRNEAIYKQQIARLEDKSCTIM